LSCYDNVVDRIVILGGYGTAGLAISNLLIRQAPVDLVLAGRDERKACTAAEQQDEKSAGGRVAGLRVDAGDRLALTKALEGARIVVVASSTIQYCANVAESALDAGVDYFDIQLSSRRKLECLKALAPRIERAGRCFITDGGYHPGLPAALVRYTALGFDELRAAVTASVMRLPWSTYKFSAASVEEFTEELKEHRPLFFKDGRWAENWAESRVFDFGPPFGKLRCAPMGLEELTELPATFQSLRETGFYANSFDGFTSNVVLPLGFVSLTYFPRVTPLFQRLFLWSIASFAKPPFGVVMIAESTGVKSGRPKRIHLRLAHEDSYVFTAAPAVACLNQYLSGAIHRTGLHWQANLVEPAAFLQDLQKMGLTAEVEESVD
jgi:saccharopine dehydrogenase-like NADP-dependent oxidoreductase